MDFWTRVRTHLKENVEFDAMPETPCISLDAADMETVTLHGTWMTEHETAALGNEEEEVREHPTQRRVEIADGALWKAARDRLQTARGRVDVDGEIDDVTLYCPEHEIPFVESDGETLRLLVTTTTALDADTFSTARQHIADAMHELDAAVTPEDITTLEAFFDDFAENTLSSVNATVLTTTPSNYHPDVNCPEDVADAVAETPEERKDILAASTYGERYLGRKHDDSLDARLVPLFETWMTETADKTVTSADNIIVEGETIRAKWADFPDDAYDIMGPQSMWVEGFPVGAVETSFWVHVPL